MRHGFPVVAAFDTDNDHLGNMPEGVAHAKTPREVAEMVDVVVTGDKSSFSLFNFLRDCVSVLEIVFVGQCEVFVLNLYLFSPWLRSS